MRFLLGWFVATVLATVASIGWMAYEMRATNDLASVAANLGTGSGITLGFFMAGTFAIATAICRTWPRLWVFAFPFAGAIAALGFPTSAMLMEHGLSPVVRFGVPITVGGFSGLAGG